MSIRAALLVVSRRNTNAKTLQKTLYIETKKEIEIKR